MPNLDQRYENKSYPKIHSMTHIVACKFTERERQRQKKREEGREKGRRRRGERKRGKRNGVF